MKRVKQGPRQLPVSVRADILDRLRGVALARFPSVRKFGQAVGVGSGTTSRWFGREAALPDAPALYRVVTNAGISLDWLMTGKGARLHEPDTGLELDQRLRNRLVTELTSRGVSAEVADWFTQPAAGILDAVVDRHIEDWRIYSARQRLLARSRGRRARTIADAIREELEEKS